MLIKGKINYVPKSFLVDLFGVDYSDELLFEFSGADYRSKILRRDFNVPTISEEVKMSEDRKYIIINNKPKLAKDVIKISLERI